MLVYAADAALFVEKARELANMDIAPLLYDKAAIFAIFEGRGAVWNDCISLKAGDWRVWIKKYGVEGYGVFCMTRGDDRDKSTLQGLRARADVERITFDQMRRRFSAKNATGFAIGDRVGCAGTDKGGLLARVVGVDAEGRITGLAYDDSGAVVPPDGLKWFKWLHRAEAFESYWSAGRTRFGSYLNMLTVMANRQKKLNPADYAVGKALKAADPHAPGALKTFGSPNQPAPASSPSAPAAAQPAAVKQGAAYWNAQPRRPWGAMSFPAVMQIRDDQDAAEMWAVIQKGAREETDDDLAEVLAIYQRDFPPDDVKRCAYEAEHTRRVKQAIENLI